jgi:hypothetical protein
MLASEEKMAMEMYRSIFEFLMVPAIVVEVLLGSPKLA